MDNMVILYSVIVKSDDDHNIINTEEYIHACFPKSVSNKLYNIIDLVLESIDESNIHAFAKTGIPIFVILSSDNKISFNIINDVYIKIFMPDRWDIIYNMCSDICNELDAFIDIKDIR